jgi:hypothetical protein
MKRATCWMRNLSVVLLTTVFAYQAESLAQDELPPPNPDQLEATQVDEAREAEPPPAPANDNPARPIEDYQPYLGLTPDRQIRDAVIAKSVTPGSPAENAGLQPGDIIEAINGRPVSSYEELVDAVDAMRPGDRVDIDYARQIRVQTQAVLDARPAQRRQTARYAPRPEPEPLIDEQEEPQTPDPLPAPSDSTRNVLRTPEPDFDEPTAPLIPEPLPAPADATRYTPRPRPDRSPDVQAQSQEPEALPAPPEVDRQRLNAWLYGPRNDRRYNTAATRATDDVQETRRIEEEQQRRPPERPRGFFQRGNRERPLFRWRRN